MIKALAAVNGASQADVIRGLVRQAHANLFEHRQLRLRVLALATANMPLRPTDFVAQLAQFFPPQYVGWNVNAVLDRLHAEGLIQGNIGEGYTITPLGQHARGF